MSEELIQDYYKSQIIVGNELTDFGLELYSLEYYAEDMEGNEVELKPVK